MKIQAISTVNNQKKKDNSSFKGHTLVKTLQDPNYSKLNLFVYKLTNGQTVVVAPKKGPDAITVNSVVKTGGFNESDKNRGISHFMEHLAFDGSRKGSFENPLQPHEFDMRTEGKGASINAHTGLNLTAYFFSIAGASLLELKDMMKAHAQMVKYPAFPIEPYEKEQQVVIQEIKQSKDKPMVEFFYKGLKDILGVNSTSTHLVLGEEANIANMHRSDVFNYHRANYSPDNIETYVVGDVDPERTVDILDQYFDTPDFRQNKATRIYEPFHPLQKTTMNYMVNDKIQQPTINMDFNGPKNMDIKEFAAMNALSTMLGNTLEKKLGEVNIASGIYCCTFTNRPQDPSFFQIEASMQSGEEQKALDIISNTLEEVKSKPIDDEKLSSIKKNLLNEINKQCESTQGISDLMEDFSVMGGIDNYAQQVSVIKSLTSEDISNAAKKYLDTQKTSVNIINSPKNKQSNVSFKGHMQFITAQNLTQKTLKNGVNLIINDNPDTIRSAIKMNLVGTSPSAKPGINQVLARMLDRSTAKKTFSELHDVINKDAITMGVGATDTGLTIMADMLPDSTKKAVEIANEIILDPNLSEENFKNAKSDIFLFYQNEIPDSNDRAEEILFKGTPFAISTRMLRNSIENIEFKDVINYYESLMKNPTLNVSVTGPIETVEGLKEDITSALQNLNKTFNSKSIIENNIGQLNKPKIAVQIENTQSQSDILQDFHVKETDAKTNAALKVMSSILSGGLTGRLFMDLRETQKLAYQVGGFAMPTPYFTQMKFIIKTGTKDLNGDVTNNIEKSIKGFEKHQQMLMDDLVPQEELIKAKRIIKTRLIQAFAKANYQNTSLFEGTWLRNDPKYADNLMQEIDNITPEDIRETARKYFSQPSVISIVTNEESAKKAEDFLKSLGEYKLYKDWKDET